MRCDGQGVEALLANRSWYRLLIPAEELAFDSFEKVRLWQEIAVSLLKKYTFVAADDDDHAGGHSVPLKRQTKANPDALDELVRVGKPAH